MSVVLTKRATKRALDNLGIPFFLSHGSLLGWFRECEFILHTHDIDFGVPSTAVIGRINEMVDEMAKHGTKKSSIILIDRIVI